MKRIYLALLAAAMLVPAAVQGQTVVEDWIVTGGSGAASGNEWIDSATNAGRGIDFIAADATQNTFDADLIAVLTGTGATVDIEMLRASDGFNFGNFATQTTGDATINKYRLATSEDGYIFVNGFAGTVQRYTMTGTLETVVDSADYTAIVPAVSGSSRALEVTGNVELGTARIFVNRGGTIVVFGNTLVTPDDFVYLGQIISGFPADVHSIGSHDGSNIWTSNNQGIAIKKFTVVVTPVFSVSASAEVVGYLPFVKQGLAVNADNTLGAVGESGGAQDGFAIADVSVDGLTWENIAPAPGLDGEDPGDFVYDAGAINMDAANLTVDIAMDPATGNVYGYSSNTSTTPTSTGSVFRLSVDETSNVSDWAIY